MHTTPLAPDRSVATILRRGVALTPSLVSGTLKLVALGDALGLPVETWSAAKIAVRFGKVEKIHDLSTNNYFSHLPRGCYSDDTQLTLAVAQGIVSPDRIDLDRISAAHVAAMRESSLGWGKTTLSAIEKISRGSSTPDSEATHAPNQGYGNGVIMKISPVALWAVAKPWRDPEEVVAVVHAIAQLTHRTPIAAATAVGHVFGLIYNLASNQNSWRKSEFLSAIEEGITRSLAKFPTTADTLELRCRVALIRKNQNSTPASIIAENGAGSVRALDSAPFSWAFFTRTGGSFQSVVDVISAGGDTDSNGAIVGSLVGALAGEDALPETLFREIHRNERITVESRELFRRLTIDSSQR